MSSRSRGRGRSAAAVTLVGALVSLAPVAATAAPNAFLHDIDRVNGQLRMAIEIAPEELGEALGTSEVVWRARSAQIRRSITE